MKPRHLRFWLKLFLISPVLTVASISAYQEVGLSSVPAVLQQGTLEVWVPKTFTMGLMSDPSARIINEYDWTPLLKEFESDFPGFVLHFKIFERDDFLKAVLASKENPPDVAFLDNAVQRDPLVKNDSVIQPLPLGSARFNYNGWWMIFRNAKNPAGARAFALWLVQSPHWMPPTLRTAPMAPADVAAVQAVAKDAVGRLLIGNIHDLSLLMDPEAAHFNWPYPQIKTLSTIEPLMAFGNSRLAFVLVTAVGEGTANFGMAHFALVIRKADEQWKIFYLLAGSLPRLENQLRAFDNLGLVDGKPADPEKVMLLNPVDHARVTRWPQGEIEWATGGPQVVCYVVEAQYGLYGRDEWLPRGIWITRQDAGLPSIRMRTPFGAGMQPHRWRVWAISRSGVVSTSEWRTIDFTN